MVKALSHKQARWVLDMGCERFSRLVRSKAIRALSWHRPGRSGWAWAFDPSTVLAYAAKLRDEAIAKAEAEFRQAQTRLSIVVRQEEDG